MIDDQSYRKAFVIAVFFHLFLAFMLLFESSTSRPVLTQETKNEPGELMPIEQVDKPKQEIVKAVSVDNQEVMQTVNRLKQERAMQLKIEQNRQQALQKQAEIARKQRLEEQQRLAKLKDEAAKVALERKKQIAEEQKRLKQLAQQKEQEAKRVEELKKQQQALEKKQQEAEKLAALKKKEAEQALAAAKAKAEKEKAEREAAAQQAAIQDAAQKAKIAGEVDKYKALIVNAISRHWILPENVDKSLSSKFRIRLAPDGAVLEVSLILGSGDPILDRSAETAIRKASPLPVPTDPATFNLFRDISLTVRPENVRG